MNENESLFADMVKRTLEVVFTNVAVSETDNIVSISGWNFGDKPGFKRNNPDYEGAQVSFEVGAIKHSGTDLIISSKGLRTIISLKLDLSNRFVISDAVSIFKQQIEYWFY